MKWLGCGTALLGLLILVFGISALTGLLSKTLQETDGASLEKTVTEWLSPGTLVKALPVQLGKKQVIPVVVIPNQEYVVAVSLKIQSKSVQEETDEGKRSYEARYDFPLAYKVLTDKGAPLLAKEDRVDWNSSGYRITHNSQVSAKGGTLEVEEVFSSFVAPGAGLQLDVLLQPDATYQAQASQIAFRLYQKRPTGLNAGMLTTLAPLAIGGVLLLTGAILFIIGVSTGSKRKVEVISH